MQRRIVSHILFGTHVKLTPQGKTYQVATIGDRDARGLRTVVLRDEQGKEKQVSWGTSVYVLNTPKWGE